jgi:hypothetical protein
MASSDSQTTPPPIPERDGYEVPVEIPMSRTSNAEESVSLRRLLSWEGGFSKNEEPLANIVKCFLAEKTFETRRTTHIPADYAYLFDCSHFTRTSASPKKFVWKPRA